MWKAAIGKDLSSDLNSDDWETDPDFVNEINEEEQRYGGTKTVGAIDMKQLREETEKAYEDKKKLQYEENGTGSRGYGGKFGVEKDRMDKSAVGHDYIGKVEKHSSQTDQKQGFGGKFGIEKDRMDKCAVGHDYIGKVEKHSSQTDQKQGFGGKFGVEKDRMDKSALGHDYIAKPEKHSSQIDHSRGFGGKFGVEKDRMDRSAVGHDYKSNIEKHSSQVDHKSGFGGKFGVQKDRMDRSAVGHDYISKPEVHSSQTNYTKHLKEIPSAQTEDFKASNIRAKFENLIKTSEKEPLQKPKLQKHIQTKTPLSVVNVAPELEGFKTEPEIDVLKTQEPCLEPVPELPKVVEEEKSVVIAAEVKTDEINHNPEIELHSNVPLYEQEPEEIVLNPENPGITAIALYDYQAAAEDEISFDPNDIITHVEMIDEGWWRGYCDKTKQYGLFPSNYVQLQE